MIAPASRMADPQLVYGLLAGNEAAFARIEAAIQSEHGNATKAARSLGVRHRTFMRWIERYPRLRKALKAARRETL